MSIDSSGTAFRFVAMCLAAMVLAAEIGVAMHTLHLDAAGTDTVCAFCTSGSHLAAPPAGSVHSLLHRELSERPPAALALLHGTNSRAAHRARAPPALSKHV